MKKKFWLSIVSTILLSFGVFVIPIFTGYLTNCDIFYPQMFIPMAVLFVNMLPFAIMSELVKVHYGYKEDAHKCGGPYKFFIENPHSVLITAILSVLVTIFFSFMYFKLFGLFRIRSVLYHNAFICISYLCGYVVFYVIKKNGIGYRKRDYIIFRPFMLLSIPIGMAISLIDVFNGTMRFINIPLILGAVVIMFSVISSKRMCKSYLVYSIVLVAAVSISMIFYYLFGIDKNTVFCTNHSLIIFSISFGIYAHLLFSLMYIDIFPIRTPGFKHSIEKLQYTLFNFAPVLSICFLLESIKDWKVLALYSLINFFAIFSIGKRATFRHQIAVTLLILGYIILSAYTLSQKTYYTIDFEVSNSLTQFVITFLLAIPAFVINLKEFRTKAYRLSFLRPHLSYYTTTIFSSIALLAITSHLYVKFDKPPAFPAIRFSFLYVIVSFILMVFRGIYDYDKNKNQDT